MLALLLWGIVWAVACGIIAANRGRSGIGWAVLGFCFSFVAVIVLVAIPRLETENEKWDREKAERERLVHTEAPATRAEAADTKLCPMCAETVKAAAKICHYCHYEFAGEASTPAA